MLFEQVVAALPRVRAKEERNPAGLCIQEGQEGGSQINPRFCKYSRSMTGVGTFSSTVAVGPVAFTLNGTAQLEYQVLIGYLI